MMTLMDRLAAMDKPRFLAVAELLAEPKWMRDLHVLAAAGAFETSRRREVLFVPPPQFHVVPPYVVLRQRDKV